MTGLFLYLLVINVLAFIAMGYDKSQARRKEQRVPEKKPLRSRSCRRSAWSLVRDESLAA